MLLTLVVVSMPTLSIISCSCNVVLQTCIVNTESIARKCEGVTQASGRFAIGLPGNTL